MKVSGRAKEVVETRLADEAKDAVDDNVTTVGVDDDDVTTGLSHRESEVDRRCRTTFLFVRTNDGDRVDGATVSRGQSGRSDTAERLSARCMSADRSDERWAVLSNSRDIAKDRYTEILLEFFGVTNPAIETIETDCDDCAEHEADKRSSQDREHPRDTGATGFGS